MRHRRRMSRERYWLVGLILVLLLFCWPGRAEEAKVLKRRGYFEVLHKALQEVEESIYVQMYLIVARLDDPDDPVSALIHGLIRAKDRGIEVKVIIEGIKFERCYNAFNRLKKGRVEVRLEVQRHACIVRR